MHLRHARIAGKPIRQIAVQIRAGVRRHVPGVGRPRRKRDACPEQKLAGFILRIPNGEHSCIPAHADVRAGIPCGVLQVLQLLARIGNNVPAVPIPGPIGRVIRLCIRVRLLCLLRQTVQQRKRGGGRSGKAHTDISVKKADGDRVCVDRSFAARAAHCQHEPFA